MSKLNDDPITINGGLVRFPEIVSPLVPLASELGATAEEPVGSPGRIQVEYTNAAPAEYDVRFYFGPLIDGPTITEGAVTTLLSGQTGSLAVNTPFTSTGDLFTGTSHVWWYIVDTGTLVVRSSYYLGPLTIRPVLSAQTAAANGTAGFTGAVDTTSDTGTIYGAARLATDAQLSITNIENGTGDAVAGSTFSVAVTAEGTINFSGSGLTASTNYDIDLFHRLADGTTESAVVSTAQFTTAGAAAAPDAFTSSNATLSSAVSATGDTVNLVLTGVPNDNGSAITDIEYRTNVGGAGYGSWTSLGATTADIYPITGLSPVETSTVVEVRAVNSVGNGTAYETNAATPAVSGGDTVSSFQIDGRTFTLDGTYSIVRHIDGPVAIVSSSAVGVTAPTPSGAGRDGVMKNPEVADATYPATHGWDSRISGYSSGLNVGATQQSLSPGDVLVATKSPTTILDERDGGGTYQACYVTSTAPSADSLAPAMMSWASKTGVTLESAVNWSSKVSAIPTYTVTKSGKPSAAEIIAALSFNIGFSRTRKLQDVERQSPFRWGGPSLGLVAGANDLNYSAYMLQRINEALAALMDNSYSTADRTDILVALASAGSQHYKGLNGSGLPARGMDGGQYQPQPILTFIYAWVTDNTTLMNNFTSWMGAWRQAFTADASYVADLAPFGSASNLTDWATYPYRQWTFHRRTFTRSGNNMSAVVRRGFANVGPYTGRVGDEEKGRWDNLIVTDGTNEALITADNSGDRNDGDTVSITVDDGSAFASSFTGWMKPAYTISAGDPVWGIRGYTSGPQSVIPSVTARYLPLQRWITSFLFIYNVGAMRDELLPPANFATQSCQANIPSATHDWPSQNLAGTLHEALYDQHASTILAISQPNLTP